MIRPLVANEKTTELLTVKLQNHLYLSVVRRSFDIVIVCQLNGILSCESGRRF